MARLFARIVARDFDSLQIIVARFGEKNDGFGGFELGEKKAMLTPFAPPITQQFHRHASHAAAAAQGFLPPFGQRATNRLDPADWFDLAAHIRPIDGRAANRAQNRRLVFADFPVFARLFVGIVDNRLADLLLAHFSPSPMPK